MSRTQPILTVDNVSKSFGALRVLTDVTFDVRTGETLGLIGPNGAGKTTLFNIITGFLRPDLGAVKFKGGDLGALGPEARVRAGLVRSFQKSMVFPGLSVRENLALAVRAQRGGGVSWLAQSRAVRDADMEAERMLASAELTHRADATVGSLSYGEQRMVDILISLAMRPALILLDEPTAGLAREEGELLLSLVRRHDADTSVVLIAHDLDIVFSACHRIAVLDLGCIVAVDRPAEIRANKGVQKAYLGAMAEPQ